MIKFIQPFVFKVLPEITTCARREICIDQTDISKIQLHDSSFVIAGWYTAADTNIVRFYFGKYGNPAVSFFLCTEPMVLKAQGFQLLHINI